MKSFTSSLDNNMKYTKPNRLLFRGLTEINVHYQCFPDLETTPQETQGTQPIPRCNNISEIQHLLSPNSAEETAIFQSLTSHQEVKLPSAIISMNQSNYPNLPLSTTNFRRLIPTPNTNHGSQSHYFLHLPFKIQLGPRRL